MARERITRAMVEKKLGIFAKRLALEKADVLGEPGLLLERDGYTSFRLLLTLPDGRGKYPFGSSWRSTREMWDAMDFAEDVLTFWCNREDEITTEIRQPLTKGEVAWPLR